MNRFEIGESVIAISNPLNELCQPRVKGKLYKVLDILYCSKCGIQQINITHKKTIITQTRCSCGNMQHNISKHFTKSKHFVRPSDIEKLIESAVNIEDYETAGELLKLK